MRFGVGEFTAVAFLWMSSRVCSAIAVPSNSVFQWVLLKKKMHKMLSCMYIYIYQVSHLIKTLSLIECSLCDSDYCVSGCLKASKSVCMHTVSRRMDTNPSGSL